MSCSWQANWISNSSQLYVFNPGCDSNAPIVFKIAGKGVFPFKGILRFNGDPNQRGNFPFRLGFILIKEDELSAHPGKSYFDALYNNMKKDKDIFWSDYFALSPRSQHKFAVVRQIYNFINAND